MAVLNASPESFHPASIAQGRQAVRDAAERAAIEGAAILDIGAMSTAPYKEARIDEELERDRMAEAVAAARASCALPICADTARASVARAALDAGAIAINDVTGFAGDSAMAALVAERGAGAILMANESLGPVPEGDPLSVVRALLDAAMGRARAAGIPDEHVMLDPGVGFFRSRGIPWHEWDMALLRGFESFHACGRPLLAAVSRKSFLGHLLNRPDPADRLAGSLAVALHAARCGAAAIRTHDVAATRDALAMAARLEQ